MLTLLHYVDIKKNLEHGELNFNGEDRGIEKQANLQKTKSYEFE